MLESMCVLVQNSRREFLALHRAPREIVADTWICIVRRFAAYRILRHPSGLAGSEASCKERGLPGMVLSTIPGKKYHSLFKSFLCALCGLKRRRWCVGVGVRYEAMSAVSCVSLLG